MNFPLSVVKKKSVVTKTYNLIALRLKADMDICILLSCLFLLPPFTSVDKLAQQYTLLGEVCNERPHISSSELMKNSIFS